jgi:hypothetical protein
MRIGVLEEKIGGVDNNLPDIDEKLLNKYKIFAS